MPKYTVVSGKHVIRNPNGVDTYVRQGEVVDLSEKEADKFPHKLKLVATVEQATQSDAKSNSDVASTPSSTTGKQSK